MLNLRNCSLGLQGNVGRLAGPNQCQANKASSRLASVGCVVSDSAAAAVLSMTATGACSSCKESGLASCPHDLSVPDCHKLLKTHTRLSEMRLVPVHAA